MSEIEKRQIQSKFRQQKKAKELQKTEFSKEELEQYQKEAERIALAKKAAKRGNNSASSFENSEDSNPSNESTTLIQELVAPELDETPEINVEHSMASENLSQAEHKQQQRELEQQLEKEEFNMAAEEAMKNSHPLSALGRSTSRLGQVMFGRGITVELNSQYDRIAPVEDIVLEQLEKLKDRRLKLDKSIADDEHQRNMIASGDPSAVQDVLGAELAKLDKFLEQMIEKRDEYDEIIMAVEAQYLANLKTSQQLVNEAVNSMNSLSKDTDKLKAYKEEMEETRKSML